MTDLTDANRQHFRKQPLSILKKTLETKFVMTTSMDTSIIEHETGINSLF